MLQWLLMLITENMGCSGHSLMAENGCAEAWRGTSLHYAAPYFTLTDLKQVTLKPLAVGFSTETPGWSLDLCDYSVYGLTRAHHRSRCSVQEGNSPAVSRTHDALLQVRSHQKGVEDENLIVILLLIQLKTDYDSYTGFNNGHSQMLLSNFWPRAAEQHHMSKHSFQRDSSAWLSFPWSPDEMKYKPKQQQKLWQHCSARQETRTEWEKARRQWENKWERRIALNTCPCAFGRVNTWLHLLQSSCWEITKTKCAHKNHSFPSIPKLPIGKPLSYSFSPKSGTCNSVARAIRFKLFGVILNSVTIGIG